MRLALSIALLLTGCGYVGDPQPPALHIPMQVEDLSVVQRGESLRLTFTLPKLTTEGLGVTDPGEVDVRIGASPQGEFQADSWAAGATRVPADLTDASEAGTLSVEAKVGELAGKSAIALVRMAGKSGRWSAWSNPVAITVIQPLVRPRQLRAEGAAAGIVLSWTGNAAQYRIYRKAETEQEFAVAGQSNSASFTDRAAEFGKPYQYRVMGFQTAGNREAESETSDSLAVNIEDRFPPAIPTGLAGLVGVNSIELAWERSLEKDLRGYRVYRALGEQEWQKIADLVESPSFGDRNVQPGAAYRYAVSAVDLLGNESGKSAEAKVAVP